MTMFKMFLLVMAAVCFVSGDALADKGGHGRGHSSGTEDRSHSTDEGYRRDGMVTLRIGDDDRAVLRNYLEGEFRKSCPPGLAKKHNGCLPPGIAKKSYAVGGHLGDEVVYSSVPSWVLAKLRPAPDGYKYVRVDSDVLLIGEASKKIIDAVTLLSGVGKQ